MNICIPIDKTSVITAVRLTVLNKDLTNLNTNAVVGTTYIAELATIYCGVAIFVAGATKPTAVSEPNLADIPADGIPTGNYEIETTEDDIAEVHVWDTQEEVEDNTIFNTDIVGIFAKYLSLAGGVMTGKITLDGNPTSANHAANKTYVDLFVSAVTGTGAIESSGGTTPEITIVAATTSVVGAVMLEDSVTSTSTVKAATPASVKLSYDAATGLVNEHSDITSAGADIELAVVHKDADGSSHADVVANTAAKHTQNTDTKLDNGGANEITALQAKTAYTHSQDGDIHLSSAQKTDLTDGNESNAHYHNADRARAVHTGTQAMATISDAGDLAIKNSVDLSGSEVTNKIADNIAESASRKWAGEAGADVTGDNAPQAHETSHESGGGDAIEFDSLAEGTVYKKFLATERTKLTGIATGADVTGDNAPQSHKTSHTDGSDDIQTATAGQKGLASSAQITKLDAIAALADVTGDNAPQAHENSHESGGGDEIEFDSLAEGTTYKKFLATERTTLTRIADIKNNLTSTDTDKPLSALQGKTLKDLLDTLTQDISTWICGTEDEVRTFFIDLYMYMTYNTTIYYQAGGYFLVEYFWKNDAGFPSGMTAPSTWVTADIETAGYTVLSIATSQSLLSIPKPDSDDVLYSGGLADKASLVYHIKYVNTLHATAFSQNELVDSFDPPDGVVTDAGFVDTLAAGGANATLVLDAVANKMADDSVVGRMVGESMKMSYVSYAGNPSTHITPKFIGQPCLDTTNKVWYRSTGLTNTDWAT